MKQIYSLIYPFIIKLPYNACFDWLKQRTLSENKVQVNDVKLASKFLLRNFNKFVTFFAYLEIIIIKFPYNARSDWLKQRPLSENKVQVNDIKLAFKFLLRNFDKFDPN